MEKAKSIMHYIISCFSAEPTKLGKVKLAKILAVAQTVIMSLTGVNIDSAGDLPEVISDLTSIKASRDSLNNMGDAEYVVTNVEQLLNQRGW